MKKTDIIAGVVAVILFVGIFGYVQKDKTGDGFLSGAQDAVIIGGSDLSISTTSTVAGIPVKVLDTNTAREYARITNISDTVIYLYLQDLSTAIQASSTLLKAAVPLNGVYLSASGGTYEIKSDNLYIGQVWATSTAASKSVIYMEK